MDDADAPLRTRTDVVVEELDGELIVLDPSTGDLHHLDQSATLVWRNLDGCDQASVVERISTLLGVDRARLEEDVGATIERLVDLGLLRCGDRAG